MLTRKTVILAKVEPTYGVDPVPTASANAILVKNVNLKVNGEKLTRDFVRASLSPLPFARGIKDAEVSFETELKGTGTRGVLPAYGWEGALALACGMSETVSAATSIVWQPTSNNEVANTSCTLYVYRDGIFHKLTGCRGSMKLVIESGKYASVQWNFKGLYVAPVDATPSAQTFSSVVPPSFLNASLTIGAYSPVAEKIEIDLKNTIATRKNINSATGVMAQVITGREPAGSFDPATVTEATHTFWANWSAATSLALNIGPVGATSGNIIQIAAPKLQYEDIGYADKNGDLTYQIPFTLAMNAGDDELVITFT